MSTELATVTNVDDDVCSPAEIVLIGASLVTLLAAFAGLVLSF